MSRSYRKPYATYTGSNSAKEDKRWAHRCFRALEKQSLRRYRELEDWDEYLIPHMYEASANDPWGWQRDGKPWLHKEPTLQDHLHWFYSGHWTFEEAMKHALESLEHAKKYYERLKRK